MKVLLISINSYYEPVGGSRYLRTLAYGYRSIEHVIVCKKSVVNDQLNTPKLVELKKTFISDLFSRIFISPCFLMFYLFKIVKLAKAYDVIAFHSTRLGVVALIINLLFKNKKLIIHSDNDESNLIRQMPVTMNLKGMLILIDKLLIPLSEWLCYKVGDFYTFICEKDRRRYSENFENNFKMIPVCLSFPHETKIYMNFNYMHSGPLLFTGSFDFYPNIDALLLLLKIAKELPEQNFIIAGRGISKLQHKIIISQNVKLVSDIDSALMSHFFKEAKVFISPVRHGSGMKIKIAEALSYGLPVIAHEKGIDGYEEISKEPFFEIIRGDNVSDMVDTIRKYLTMVDSEKQQIRKMAYEAFIKYYTLQRCESIIKNIICHLCENK